MPARHRPVATSHRIRELFAEEPVRFDALLAAGFTRAELRAACDVGLLGKVRHGIYQVPALDPEGRAAAEALSAREALVARALAVLAQVGHGAVISHESAALLHDLPTARPAGRDSATVHVTTPRHGRVHRGVHLWIGEVPPPDVTRIDGVRTTGLARTAVDICKFRPLQESLVVMDHVVGRESRGHLWSALDRMPIVYGRVGLREAIAAADAASESPLESASRGLMIASGLPLPELQVTLRLGELVARPDFLWRRQKVVGEADGWGKYASPLDLRDEKRREDALRRAGYDVVRWTSDELWRSPETVVRRLRSALTRG